MADGFDVNPETMISCGKQISAMADQANDLKSQCESAEVPDIAWGALGAATTFSKYQELLEKFKQHLDEVGRGVSSVGDKIAECGTEYQKHDKEISDKLTEVLNQHMSGEKV